MREEIARGLEHARGRTLALTEFDDPNLTRQHSPLTSPLVWDLAHVGQQEDPPLLGAGTPLPRGRDVPHDALLVPAGEFVLGVDGEHEPWSLDNERPAHVVDLPAFRIGRFPVTNAEWQAFITDGGYTQQRWWSGRGWQHRLTAGLEQPLFWSADGTRTRFGNVEDIPPDEPVQHICYFEAEAYAAWAGARLPTEQEWEKACVWDPAADRRRGWPWGESEATVALANL